MEIAFGSAAVLAVVWPVFVFTGAQAAYLAAAAAAGLVAFCLVWLRSRLVLAYLVLIVGLIGTEVNGTLGKGAAPLGTLRLLDIVIASAVVTLAVTAWRRRELHRPGSPLHVVRSAPGWTLSTLLVVYAIALWQINGAPVDGMLRTDVRLILLAVGTWVLVRTCTDGSPLVVGYAFATVGALCTLKALAISISELWVIGTYDRLQASTPGGSQIRVILLGGDTVLILAPAAAAVTALTIGNRRHQMLLAAAGLVAAGGLILSGTRTSLLVAAGLVLTVAAVYGVRHGARRARGIVALSLVGILGMTGALIATGVAERFVTPDPAHVGLNFRADELATLSKLPKRDLVLGQGLGGRFVGKDVNGRLVEAGWAHVLPAYIVLKLGAFGLLAAVALLARLAWLAIVALQRGTRRRAEVLLGATLVLGMVVLSLTLNRAALPEGAVLLTMAAALAVGVRRRPPAHA